MSDPSLLEQLDSQQLNCLNEAAAHGIKAFLTTKGVTPGAHLASDTDEQLLLTIPFNQTVRIKALALRTGAPHAAHAPKTLRLVINRPSVGFEDVEDAALAQELVLTPEQVASGARVPLRFVRFQSVTSLHIFVVDNQGGEDETRIDGIDVFGTPVETTRDLSGLRQQEEH